MYDENSNKGFNKINCYSNVILTKSADEIKLEKVYLIIWKSFNIHLSIQDYIYPYLWYPLYYYN